jgi:hypothetical protein
MAGIYLLRLTDTRATGNPSEVSGRRDSPGEAAPAAGMTGEGRRGRRRGCRGSGSPRAAFPARGRRLPGMTRTSSPPAELPGVAQWRRLRPTLRREKIRRG